MLSAVRRAKTISARPSIAIGRLSALTPAPLLKNSVRTIYTAIPAARHMSSLYTFSGEEDSATDIPIAERESPIASTPNAPCLNALLTIYKRTDAAAAPPKPNAYTAGSDG